MKKRVKGRQFGRPRRQRNALLNGLVEATILHGRIETTLPRAKEASRLVEKSITTARKGTVAARRQLARNYQPVVVARLVDELGPHYKEANRAGGYTRVVRTRVRRGDAAPMAVIELVK